ncbi:MAG: alpha/beta fold hydrolase [Pseudonocardiaceae bacterium]
MSTRLSWDCAGSGEPLLLLHGIGTTREDFSALRPALETDYEVLAADLPGHGDSPALSERPTVHAVTEMIEADLDALGMDPVHVLGNSSAPASPWNSRDATGPSRLCRSRQPASMCYPSGSIRMMRCLRELGGHPPGRGSNRARLVIHAMP